MVNKIFLMVLVLGFLCLMNGAYALAYPPGLSSFPSESTGNYPTYMSLRYGVYSGGNYQHYYYTTGSRLQYAPRMSQTRFSYGMWKIQPQYSPTPFYRNYYTTNYPRRTQIYGRLAPYSRGFYGESGYY